MAAIPVPYVGTGNQSQVILGHYGLAQKSGSVTGTIAAGSAFGSMRWAPSISALLVLMRIKVSVSVTTVLSTASPVDVAAQLTRGFTVDWSANMTQANMATKVPTGAMRPNMSPSQFGAKGPQIIVATAPTGATQTLDNDFFAATALSVVSTAAVGSAASAMLYEWVGLGEHPPVLTGNMGILISNITATSFGTGVVPYYIQWGWAEVLTF